MTKPDALALVDRLRFTAEAWIEGLTVTKAHMPTPEMLLEAAAELRRLHAEVEALRNALGQAVAAHEMGVLLSGEGTRQLRAAMKEKQHE